MSNFTIEKGVGSVKDENYLSIELKLSEAPSAYDYELITRHLTALKALVMIERKKAGEDE